MKLAELEDTLPNGFHDAKLLKADLDESSQLATLRLELLTSLPVEPPAIEIVEYRPASLRLGQLSVFDAPDQLLRGNWSTLDVQGFVPTEQHWPRFRSLDDRSKQLAYSFYVHDWNNSIHTVAEDAELSWREFS